MYCIHYSNIYIYIYIYIRLAKTWTGIDRFQVAW